MSRGSEKGKFGVRPVCTAVELLPSPWDRIQFVAGDFGLWRGARRGAEPQRSVTRRATKPQAKSAATLRAEAVLPWGFVARSVEYRLGYTPSLAPRPRAKRLSANCILSHGLVSKQEQTERTEIGEFHIPFPVSSCSFFSLFLLSICSW